MDDDADRVRPELLKAEAQLAELQIENWLIFLRLLQAKLEKLIARQER